MSAHGQAKTTKGKCDSVTLPEDEAEKIVTVDDLYEAVGTLLGRVR
jgi:hypothetical protein